MAIRIKKLKMLVVDEATKLIQHATKEERSKLNFTKLRSNSIVQCIYGQMTGHCYSNRANELIKLCAEKTYTVDSSGEVLLYNKPNLKHTNTRGERLFTENLYWFSPIEIFISFNATETKANFFNNNDLIKYIKGYITKEHFLEKLDSKPIKFGGFKN